MKTLCAWFLLSVWLLDLVCSVPGYADNHQQSLSKYSPVRDVHAAPPLSPSWRTCNESDQRYASVCATLSEDQAALKRLKELATTHGVQVLGVLAFYLGGKLLSGMVMLGLGMALLFKPDWLAG